MEVLVYVAAFAAPSYALQVSVCGDATYDLPKDRGVLCASTDTTISGTACPLKGDKTSTDCFEKLSSYNGSACVAPEDAVCALVTDTTWGCVFPSVVCGGKVLTMVAQEVPVDQCETWNYHVGYLSPSIDAGTVVDGSTDYNATWFVQDTNLTVLRACGTSEYTVVPTLEPTLPPILNRADLWIPEPTPAPTFNHRPISERTPAPTSLTNDLSSTNVGRSGSEDPPTSHTTDEVQEPVALDTGGGLATGATGFSERDNTLQSQPP